jgi:hypothetical protein
VEFSEAIGPGFVPSVDFKVSLRYIAEGREVSQPYLLPVLIDNRQEAGFTMEATFAAQDRVDEILERLGRIEKELEKNTEAPRSLRVS